MNMMTNRQTAIFLSILGLVLSGVFLYIQISSIYVMIDNHRFMETAVEVEAVCTDSWFEETYHNDDDGPGYTTKTYYAAVSYQYEGIQYSNPRITVSKNVGVGGTVTIYVSPTDPSDSRKIVDSDFTYIMTSLVFIPFTLVGLVFLIEGVRFLWKNKKQKKEELPVKDFNMYH